MNSEDRFKKSLEELLASKDFSFDAGNWEKAREMIDASKKPRRIVPYILAGTLLLLSLASGVYFLSDVPSATVTPLANTSEEIRSNAALPLEKSNSETKAPEIKPAITTPEPANTPNTLNKPQTITTPAPAPVNTLPDTEKKPLEVSDNTVAKQPVPEASLPQNNTPVKSAVTNLNLPVEEVLASFSTDNPVPSKVLSANEEPARPLTEKTSPSPDLSANTSNPPAAQQTPEVKKASDENFASAVEPPPAPLNTLETKTTEPDNTAIVTTNIPESTLQVPATVSLPDTANHDAKLSDLYPEDNDAGQIGKPKEIPVWFSVEAGANYMLGWQNPGTRDASGFNPVIGINYFSNLTPKTTLTFGIHYSTVSKLAFSTYTSKVTRLAMGEESQVTIFTPVTLHYLIWPLRLNYHLTPMNTIGIGCNISYLLNVDSEVETYNEKLNTKYDQNLSKTSGYMGGFKKYDTQVSVFYKRTLHPKLALNLEMYYGLTDIKDNAFFNSNVFERNTGLKLTLVYNFLKK